MPSFSHLGYHVMKIPEKLFTLILENMDYNEIIPDNCHSYPPVQNCKKINSDNTSGKQKY